MNDSFGPTSTTDEVLRGINLSGKRVLVTRCSAGLGIETARALAAHGAQVIGAARDLPKARTATERVRARRPRAAVLSRSSRSTWPHSTACAAAPTVCSPRPSLSTSSLPMPGSWRAPRAARPTDSEMQFWGPITSDTLFW